MSGFSLLSNLNALRVERQLALNTSQLSRGLERLSSGLRINHASDDAAGLAISSTLNANTRVFNQGVRNLNDGISLLNIAEGTLTQASTINQRLKELATQAANGSYSSVQRSALDVEARSLVSEYNRLLGGARFNGLSILSGGFGYLGIQAGYGTDGQVGYNLGRNLERAAGTGGYQIGQSFTAPIDILTEDFNNDGKLDLVAMQYPGSGTLITQLGNGDGTFASAVTTATSLTFAVSMTAGDWNRDGYKDIAFIGTDNTLHVWNNLGNGTFTNTASYTAIGLGSLATADFNGDGDADLIATNGSGSVLYYSGASLSNFNSAVTIGNVSGAAKIDVGDINNDGRTDILVAGTTRMGTILSNGNGTFGAVSTFASSITATTFVVDDFNGDGNVDIAARTSTTLVLLSGLGNGSFNSSAYSGVFSGGNGLKSADMNNDGILDLISERAIHLGNGDGTFQRPMTHSSSGSSLQLVGDFNRDGVNDIFRYGPSSSVLLAITQNTTTAQYVSLGSQAGALNALATIEAAQNRISSELGMIGAYQSRFQVALTALQEQALTSAAASNRITDVDMASEAAEVVRRSILRDTGAAMLGQSQQSSQIALQLLSNL